MTHTDTALIKAENTCIYSWLIRNVNRVAIRLCIGAHVILRHGLLFYYTGQIPNRAFNTIPLVWPGLQTPLKLTKFKGIYMHAFFRYPPCLLYTPCGMYIIVAHVLRRTRCYRINRQRSIFIYLVGLVVVCFAWYFCCFLRVCVDVKFYLLLLLRSHSRKDKLLYKIWPRDQISD